MSHQLSDGDGTQLLASILSDIGEPHCLQKFIDFDQDDSTIARLVGNGKLNPGKYGIPEGKCAVFVDKCREKLSVQPPGDSLPAPSLVARGGAAAAPTPVASTPPYQVYSPPSVDTEDLGLRLLTPLPGNERVIPHLTCSQAWRAWFLVTNSLPRFFPYPLRYAEGKLGLGSDITALSRMKTVMNVLSQGIHGRDILQHTEATFQCAFAHLQTQLFDVDANLRIYSYNTCGTIEKKLRNAKASGWHPTNATFNVGVIPKRPDIYDAAEVQEQQLTRRENAVRATNAFQCERCASLCMHCMHCDTCVVRLDAAVSRYNEVAQAPALGEGDASVAVEFLPPRKEGVRCLRCMRAFYDKSGFNRHLRTTPQCTPSRFEFVLREDNGVRKVAPPPPHPDATGQAVSMYVRTNTSNIYE